MIYHDLFLHTDTKIANLKTTTSHLLNNLIYLKVIIIITVARTQAEHYQQTCFTFAQFFTLQKGIAIAAIGYKIVKRPVNKPE